MHYRLGLILVLGACGSNSPSGPTVLDACTQVAAARCTRLQTCSESDLERRNGDLASCEARDLLACQEALIVPDTGNTPTNVIACANALNAQPCADFLGKSPPAECATQMGPGSGACGFSAECETAFCAVPNNSECGTCAAPPVVGTSCADQGCGQTLVCVATTMTCQQPGAAGDPCSADLPCGDSFGCVASMDRCMPLVETVGAPCDPTNAMGPACRGDDGLVCDSMTKTCVTQPLAAAGQPCGPVTPGIFTGCTGAGTCVHATGQAGTCVGPAADLAACDTAVGPTCLAPARCVITSGTAGTCQLPGSMTCN